MLRSGQGQVNIAAGYKKSLQFLIYRHYILALVLIICYCYLIIRLILLQQKVVYNDTAPANHLPLTIKISATCDELAERVLLVIS